MPEVSDAAQHPVALDRQGSRLALGRMTLEVRQSLPRWKHSAILAASLAIGLAIGVVSLMLAGVDGRGIFDEFLVYTFFRSRGLGDVLEQSGPLILVGLAAAVAFRIQFWNIGLEGQLILGAMGAAAVAIYDIGPEGLRLPLMLAASLIGGALWTLVPVLLKLRLNVNEIISTLLLNYVAYLLLMHQLYGSWQDRQDRFPHTEQFEPFERLTSLGAGLEPGLVIALLAGLVVWWIAAWSRLGLFMTFIGANPHMSRAVGLPVAGAVLAAVLISGALAGLGGFVVVAGQEFRLTVSFSEGYLFSGIVIAFLARNNPVAAMAVAFLLGGLYVGGQSIQIFYNLSAGIISLLQAIIVMCVTASELFTRYRVVWRR